MCLSGYILFSKLNTSFLRRLNLLSNNTDIYNSLAIIYAVIFIAAIWTVPKTQTEVEKFTLATLKKFDLFGILLSMTGIALFCSSLT
jgi:hypothetical protein